MAIIVRLLMSIILGIFIGAMYHYFGLGPTLGGMATMLVYLIMLDK